MSPPDTSRALLELVDVSKVFPVRQGVLRRVRAQVHAVSHVSIALSAGETLGLVGESGSGKSTLGRVATGVVPASSGEVLHAGTPLGSVDRAARRSARRRAQMVFQDPYSSFDPLLTLRASVGEPIDVHLRLSASERRDRLHELVAMVGLQPHHLDRYPRELSGGQLQRLAIARALAVRPDLVVLDEPVSSLDVSTQAQVINLLEQLQRELGVSYLFIAHNPALVAHASDRIAVMYLGEVVEIGDADTVHDHPKHPYTHALLSAVPEPDPDRSRSRRVVLAGDVPDPSHPPPGCRFHTRCPLAMEVCGAEPPPSFVAPDGVTVRCHLHTAGPRLGGAPIERLVGAPGRQPASVPVAAPARWEPLRG